MFRLLGIFTICMFISMNNVNCQDVVVHFMDVNYNEFVASVATVKTAIGDQFSDYCKKNDCKITVDNRKNITGNDVTFIGATDKAKYQYSGRFVITKISIVIYNNQVISNEVLEQFFTDRRQQIVDNGKIQIAYVNNKLVYPPRDNLDNYIIISVSAAFTLALFIFNVILTKKSNEKEEEELKKPQPEKNPLILKTSDLKKSETKSTRFSDIKPNNALHQSNKSISRSEAFDQKIDPKLNNSKHRKRNRSGSGSMIAGHVGSRIGSTRNMAEEEKWYSFQETENLIDQLKQNSSPHSMKRNSSSEGPFKHVTIPIDTSMNSEEADSKVAARLAKIC